MNRHGHKKKATKARQLQTKWEREIEKREHKRGITFEEIKEAKINAESWKRIKEYHTFQAKNKPRGKKK